MASLIRPQENQFDDASDDDTMPMPDAPLPRIDDDTTTSAATEADSEEEAIDEAYEGELSKWYAQNGIEEEYEEEQEEDEGLEEMGRVEDADWEMARGGE